MGISALGAKIVAYFMEPLQVDLGNLVPLPDLFKIVNFFDEFLEDIITDFPIKRKDDRFKTS